MFASTILSWVLAAAPETSTLAEAPPSRADVTRGSDWARVLTYDTAGEVSAELVVWSVDEEIRIDAAFPDGAAVNATIVDGGVVDIECVDCASARAQIEAVLVHLDPDALQGSWFKCAGYAALTVGEIATGHPWLAIPTAILAACECFEAYDEAKECF